MVFCKNKSNKAAQRTFDKILPFIEETLYLRVNQDKTKVSHINSVNELLQTDGCKKFTHQTG